MGVITGALWALVCIGVLGAAVALARVRRRRAARQVWQEQCRRVLIDSAIHGEPCLDEPAIEEIMKEFHPRNRESG